jgi:hypothetical protein
MPSDDARQSSTGARSRPSVLAFTARVLLLLGIASLPVAFSFVVDPARLFTSSRAEEAIAHALASGRNVVGFTSFDDRSIERSLAGLRPRRAEVLALGSSRMQLLPASAFPDVVMANAAMSGATMDDVIGVYGLYDTKERRPTRVVLGVDPWSQSYSAPLGWRSLIVPRAKILERLGVPVFPWRERYERSRFAVTQLASPEYFRLSLLSFRRSGLKSRKWIATTREQNTELTKLSNGTLVWPVVSPDSAVRLTSRYVERGFQEDNRFQRLQERRRRQTDVLERFVRYLKAEGIAVTIVLVPYPPEVFAAFGTLPEHPVDSVEASLRTMAARTGARLVGSYDPRPYGLTARDFFDESHLRPGPLATLVSSAR